MVYCFDLDDTICIHRNRDYPNAIPVERTINNMRSLRSADHGAKIIIYTSRGMNSCNGDAALAERKNRDTIEKWLSKNRVPYDEIIFGKPLADVYIDDKGMSAESFKNGGIEVLNGFSGASVIRLSDVVIKEGDRVAFEYGWYKSNAEQNFKTHMVPAVGSSARPCRLQRKMGTSSIPTSGRTSTSSLADFSTRGPNRSIPILAKKERTSKA